MLLGMECYATSSPPIPGIIRLKLDDFQVFEVDERGITVRRYDMLRQFYSNMAGLYSLFLLEKKGLSHYEAVRIICNLLNVDSRSLSFSGIKDTRAHTWQLFSVRGYRKEWNNFDKLLCFSKERFLRVSFISRYPWRLYPGCNKGNLFHVVIRRIPSSSCIVSLSKILSELRELGGIPNFYGYQRFGTIRPNTHIIGKYVLLGNYKSATKEILTSIYPYESEIAKKARAYLKATWDLRGALRIFPKSLSYERLILNYLIKHPNKYERCFCVLPKWLRGMFIEAYQSYLFNRILSKRLLLGISLKDVIDGDLVYLTHKDAIITATSSNISYLQKLVDLERGVICQRIIGFDYKFHNSFIGEIEREILEEEGISPSHFYSISRFFPRLRGGYRKITQYDFRIKITTLLDDAFPSFIKAKLEFFLEKGFYATSFLREIIKSGNPIKSGF